jgi:GTPase Era involved in 16S rRNA processing
MSDYFVVIGCISSGKSTFINAIIEENKVRTGRGVTTTKPLFISKNDLIDRDVLGDLKIVDLPGLNESDKDQISALKKYKDIVKNALGVFYIFNESDVDSGESTVILKALAQWRKHLPDEEIYVILNKIDEIGGLPEKREKYIRILTKKIRKKLKLVKLKKRTIISISSRYALVSTLFSKNLETEEQFKFIIDELYGKVRRVEREDILLEDMKELYYDSNFAQVCEIINNIKTNLEEKIQLRKNKNYAKKILDFVDANQANNHTKIIPFRKLYEMYDVYNDNLMDDIETAVKSVVGENLAPPVLSIVLGLGVYDRNKLYQQNALARSYDYLTNTRSDISKSYNKLIKLTKKNRKIHDNITDRKYKDKLLITLDKETSMKVLNVNQRHIIMFDGNFDGYKIDTTKPYTVFIYNENTFCKIIMDNQIEYRCNDHSWFTNDIFHLI